MLRLTLELLPYGKEKGKKHLKKIEIANDGWHENLVQYANYKVKITDNPHTENRWYQRYITDYPREKYDALYLCYLVLRKMVHEDGVDPIDSKAEQDKRASGGSGHSYISDGSQVVGGPGYQRSNGHRGKMSRADHNTNRSVLAPRVSKRKPELPQKDLS